ncbi:MAG: alpha/beta fold hydrolase [Cyanobium sp.]
MSFDPPGPAALPRQPQPQFQQRLPWWGPDLQTLRDTLRPQWLPEDCSGSITIELGGGEALLARYGGASGPPVAGLVVIVPGLGGCSEGRGARRLADHLVGAGFAVLRLNMRGAGAGRPLASGTYAALCNRDLLPALALARQLADQLAGQAGSPGRSVPLFGVGLSLGGTMLLNGLLAGPAAAPLLDGLVCVSSPLDLNPCSEQFDQPRNRIYRRWVLRRLRQLTLADPWGVLPAERRALTGAARVRTLRSFDARITAPRWGFGSVEAYYEAASPLQPLLAAVGAGVAMPPILLIHAADDPWVPVAATRRLAAAAERHGCAWLEALIPAHGGHNGFHSREVGGRSASWADRQTADWLRRKRLNSDGPG